MNDLLTSGVLTMDSRDIAEMTGKRHDHVCRDIQVMLAALGGVPNFGHTYRNEQNGQEYQCYKLPKRECLILVSGYSVELRAAIIDRWAELEAAQGHALPQTFAQALRALADKTEEAERQQRQLAIQAPKAAFYDAVTGSRDAVDLGTVAKTLAIKGYGRNNLFDLLRKEGVLMENNVPYQRYVDSKCFRVIESSWSEPDGTIHVNFKTVVYQKGIDFIRRIVEKAMQ